MLACTTNFSSKFVGLLAPLMSPESLIRDISAAGLLAPLTSPEISARDLGGGLARSVTNVANVLGEDEDTCIIKSALISLGRVFICTLKQIDKKLTSSKSLFANQYMKSEDVCVRAWTKVH